MDGDTSFCCACGRAVDEGAPYCLSCGVRIAALPQNMLVRRFQQLFAFVREAGQPFERFPEASLRLYRHSPVDHY